MTMTIAGILRENRHWLILAALATASVIGHEPASAQQTCGDGTEGLKVDYNNVADTSLINNINRNHFNDDVRNLRRGETGSVVDDLNYALWNAPNHHKVLYVMAEYHLRERTEKFEREAYPMPCWFERAMRFAPTDAVVPMIYGIYLHRKGDLAEAERQYKHSTEMAPEFAEAHYNLGLLYLDKKQFADARAHAREAYRLGYPLPGLREKLMAAGAWVEPGQ